jgi:hypothetical protein
MGLINVTENSDLTVKLSWALPTENGAPVSSYKIMILAKDGINYFVSTYCNGADPSITASRQCNIPMVALRQLPFLLQQGDLIVAIGQSTNEIGTSPFNAPSISTILVSQPPWKPPAAPTMIQQAITFISVSMSEVTGLLTGGSPILSYNLQYMGQLTDPSDFLTIIGEVPDSMALTYVKNGLLTDYVYVFRYRVRNKHGWGPFSDYVYIRTAVIPDQVETAQFSIVQQTSVRMTWKAPYNGGNAITSYVILFADASGNNFYPIKSYCDGNSSTIVSQRYCDIPFTTLRADPFNLVQD